MPQQTRAKHSRSFGGCVRCKQQRTKCGQEKPSCVRCQRNGHTCIYEATLIRTYDPLSKRVKQPLPRAAGRETVEMVHLGFMGDSSHQDSSSDSRSRSSTQANSPDLSPAVQPLHETALNDQLISHFFGSSMPGQYKGQLGWLPLVMAMPHKSVAVTRGLRAVALGRVGWLRRDEHLIACARRTYTEALKATQAELWDPRQQWNESTLVAMQLLRVYELASGGSFLGCITHTKGICSYLVAMNKESAWENTGLLTYRIIEDASQHLLYCSVLDGVITSQELLDALQNFEPRCPVRPDTSPSKAQIDASWLSFQLWVLLEDLLHVCNDPSSSLATVQTQASKVQKLLFGFKQKADTRLPKCHRADAGLTSVSADEAYGYILFAGDMLTLAGYVQRFIRAVTPDASGSPAFEIHPELKAIASPEYTQFLEESLRFYLPLLHDGSALSMVRAYGLLWMFFINGKNAIEDSDNDFGAEFARATGIKAAECFDVAFRVKFWNALGTTTRRRQVLFSRLLDQNIRESGNMIPRPFDHKGRQWHKFPHTDSADMGLGIVHRAHFDTEELGGPITRFASRKAWQKVGSQYLDLVDDDGGRWMLATACLKPQS